MSEFKVGNRVTVIGVTPNESFERCSGVIVRAGGFHDWIVDVTFPDGNHDELGYDEFELTATAQPAPAHAAGDSGYTELIDELHGRIKGLEAQLEKKNIQQKMYKHTIELHEEQYNQARDNATLIRRALQKHAPEAWAEVAKQLNQNVNEYDKLMSDATRGREALAQLAATEARLQAAEAFYALMVNIDVLGDIADSLANEETWEVWGELAHLTEVLRGEWNPLPASEKGE